MSSNFTFCNKNHQCVLLSFVYDEKRKSSGNVPEVSMKENKYPSYLLLSFNHLENSQVPGILWVPSLIARWPS